MREKLTIDLDELEQEAKEHPAIAAFDAPTCLTLIARVRAAESQLAEAVDMNERLRASDPGEVADAWRAGFLDGLEQDVQDVPNGVSGAERSTAELARRFGVSRTTVKDVRSGRIWR